MDWSGAGPAAIRLKLSPPWVSGIITLGERSLLKRRLVLPASLLGVASEPLCHISCLRAGEVGEVDNDMLGKFCRVWQNGSLMRLAFGNRHSYNPGGIMFPSEVVPGCFGGNLVSVIYGEFMSMFRSWPEDLGSDSVVLYKTGMDLAE